MSDNIKKWACEYCTYENYPSTIKCTMCRGAKPFEDIYKLNDGGRDDRCSPIGATASVEVKNVKDKTCQCDNCSNFTNCSSCISTFTTASNLHEHIMPLRISQNSGSDQNLARNTSPPSSLLNLENSKKSAQSKWMCQTCTYENWPKSLRCAMCGTQNNQRSPPGSRIMSASPERKNSRDDINQSAIIDPSQNNIDSEHCIRQLRRNADWNWLNACMGVIEGDPIPVEAYLASGGDPARSLTASECALLNRNSAFDVGFTLVHLAIRFQREDLLAALLSQIEGSGGSGIKRVPSYVAPDLAADIRRHFATTLRQRKGSFPCHYVTEFPTFTLPAEVSTLPVSVQEQLMSELLDKDAQEELEGGDAAVINWAIGAGVCRLYALWNRSAGDCLLDSVMQATWGVFDRDNTLRRALAETLVHAGYVFYPRWKEYESSHASFLQYSLEDAQWEDDWSSLVALAAQPGSSLEQLHVFALAHILRRPILVYGVKVVKSFRGEALCPARFEGIYLPLLWDHSFCSRSPLALGYTRGHFSALVSIESVGERQRFRASLLPLVDRDRKPLPIHFLLETELGREETILRQWMDVTETEDGILVAQQHFHKRPLLVAQICEEWLNHYRRIIQMSCAPFERPVSTLAYSSEEETDCE
ncbi:ubiquitin thioesterase trabid isoform X2 [Anthonomus grandis grandis]|uniref:ubiquitin thioesterase trabid isoform X2 n=1 Tax=Anthonomus grandis grandis TaxID=2921223 RepID=UPI0021661CE3|nr:ubiquitin thioesterase trabid isoform X2 [Anthonomus grandis grandis]